MNSNDFYSDNSDEDVKAKPILKKKSSMSLADKVINKEKKIEIKKQKDFLKQQALQEKSKQKLLQNEAKSLKPGECMKHILVMIDNHLREVQLFNKLHSVLEQSEINHDFISQPIPYMITLLRTVVSINYGDDQQIQNKTSSNDFLQENMVLYLPVVEFLSMINSFKLKKECAFSNNIDIEDFTNLCNQTVGQQAQLSFIIVGLHDYLKNLKLKGQHGSNKEDRKSKNHLLKGDQLKISFYDISETMLYMQLHFGLQAYFLANEDDLMKFLLNFIKATAEKPFKQSLINSGRIYDLLKSNQGMKLSSEVDGCSKVWLQQLQQFKNLSIDVANAIVSVYPSPLHLIQAYDRCLNDNEKDRLLEDLDIRRGAGITLTKKKKVPTATLR